MAEQRKKFETVLTLEKQTKGTYRYREDPEHPPIVGYIYLKKWVLGPQPPRKIKITFEVLE